MLSERLSKAVLVCIGTASCENSRSHMDDACTTFQKLGSKPVSRGLRQRCIALSMKRWQGSHCLPGWLHSLTSWHLSSGHRSCRSQGMLPLACWASICAASCPAALGTAPASRLTPAASTMFQPLETACSWCRHHTPARCGRYVSRQRLQQPETHADCSGLFVKQHASITSALV